MANFSEIAIHWTKQKKRKKVKNNWQTRVVICLMWKKRKIRNHKRRKDSDTNRRWLGDKLKKKKIHSNQVRKKIAKRTLIFTLIFSSARPLLFNPRAPLLPSAFWVLFDQISTITRICDGLIINNWYRTLRIIEKHIYFVLRFNVTEWTEPADWWHDIPCRANTHTIAQHINCAALKYSAMRMK